MKFLKHQQKINSRELVTAHKDDGYPLKIRQLTEDIRISKDKAETYQHKLHTLERELATAESEELKMAEADSDHLRLVEEFISLEQAHKTL
jgi:hypothetical protein